MKHVWRTLLLILLAVVCLAFDAWGMEMGESYDPGALPKSGGILTGPVSGTDATFTGTASASEGVIASLSVTATATFNGVEGISLDEIGDLGADKIFTLANKTLSFRYTNPAGGIEWVWQGNASGHLFTLHQETGNPIAGTHLAHLGASDADVLLLHLVHDGTPTPGYFAIDTTDDASSTGYIFWVNGAGETLIGSDTDAGAFRLQVFGDTYLGGNASVTGILDADNLTINTNQVATEGYVTAAIAAIPGNATSGDEVTITTATTSYILPIDGATTVLTVASGAVVMADFWISAQASSTVSAAGYRLSVTYDGFNGTINEIGSEVAILHRRNASTWNFYTDQYGRAVASVPANVRVKVTKAEITTQAGD